MHYSLLDLKLNEKYVIIFEIFRSDMVAICGDIISRYSNTNRRTRNQSEVGRKTPKIKRLGLKNKCLCYTFKIESMHVFVYSRCQIWRLFAVKRRKATVSWISIFIEIIFSNSNKTVDNKCYIENNWCVIYVIVFICPCHNGVRNTNNLASWICETQQWRERQ